MTLVALVAAVAIPARAHAARILFVADASADASIASVLESDGHDVTAVMQDWASGNAALRQDLSAYDAVYWSATGAGYGDVHGDAAIFENLRAFAERGGRVFVTGYDSVASPADPMLIELLGASGSTDVPPAPGPVTSVACSLTVGRVDIRGLLPQTSVSDRDTLTGLGPDTIEVVGTPNGGAQWTLRRVGRGEIAYVSHGTAESDTEGWSITTGDGAGVYRAALLNFASAAAPFAIAPRDALPSLGEASPRRAHVMYLLSAQAPAVMVAPDRAWIAEPSEAPLTLCAGNRCQPVREVTTCSAPACPGAGWLVIARERVADVSDYPSGRDEFNRERASLSADPALAPLAPSMTPHPDPGPGPRRPPRFVRGAHDWIAFELGAQGGIGALTSTGTPIGALSVTGGVRITPGTDDEALDLIYGTSYGVDARVTLLPGLPSAAQATPRPEDLGVLIGIAPQLAYAVPGEPIRLPSLVGWMLPELGLALRTDGMAPAFYAQWSASIAALVDEHVGFEGRASVAIIDEWIAGDDVEAVIALSAGFVFR